MTSSTSGNAPRKRREALLRLARRAAAESDPLQVMRALLREAQQLHGANGGIVGRWDEERQVLVELVNTIPGVAAGEAITLGESATGRAAALRAPIIVNDYQRYESAVQKSLEANTQAVLAAPLLHEGRLLGVVVIVSDRPRKRFTSDDADSLVMMGGIAASTLVALERNRSEERLRLQTERLEQVAEVTSDAIIMTNRDMRILAWNRGAEQLYGWDRQEVLDRPLPFIPADREQEADRLWRRVLERGETVANYEEVRLTKDGRRIPIMATISPVWDAAGAIVGLMGIAKDLSVHKAVEEQQRMLARLEERESIAMDLHDNTMQTLHGAVLGLAAAERTADTDVEQLRAALRLVRDQLNGAIRELRTYVDDLHPHGARRRCLSAGLVALAEQARLNAHICAELEIDETVELLISSESIVQLLAIASEATFNAIRHARATSVAMRVSREDGLLVLVISDDGCGFDAQAPAPSTGQGLANMSERAGLMGARLAVVSRAGSGTEVRVQLPLGEDVRQE